MYKKLTSNKYFIEIRDKKRNVKELGARRPVYYITNNGFFCDRWTCVMKWWKINKKCVGLFPVKNYVEAHFYHDQITGILYLNYIIRLSFHGCYMIRSISFPHFLRTVLYSSTGRRWLHFLIKNHLVSSLFCHSRENKIP